MDYDIHGGHGETGAVGEHTDVPVELDELEAESSGGSLQMGQRLRCGPTREPGLAGGGCTVDDELAVQRHHLACRSYRERVDLDQFRIAVPMHPMQPYQGLGHRRGCGGNSRRRHEVEGGVAIQVPSRIDVQAPEQLRMGTGHLLDVDATALGEDHPRRGAAGVVEDRGVQFPRSFDPFLDQGLGNQVAAQAAPDQFRGDCMSLTRGPRRPDAT